MQEACRKLVETHAEEKNLENLLVISPDRANQTPPRRGLVLLVGNIFLIVTTVLYIIPYILRQTKKIMHILCVQFSLHG